MKCKYCGRELVDKSFKTKNGCILCDCSYYETKEEEDVTK